MVFKMIDNMDRLIDTSHIKWPLCTFQHGDWPSTKIYDRYSYELSSESTLGQAGGNWGDHFTSGNPHKEKQKPYFIIADKLGLENYHVLIQTQMPGQQMAMHLDGGSRKRYSYLSDADHKSELKRAFVFLEDWKEGQIIQMGDHNIAHWKKGQVLAFDWTAVKHGTANFGSHERPMLCVTGTKTTKWNDLWGDRHNKIIDL